MMRWETIETAPRDGSDVLLWPIWSGAQQVAVGSWKDMKRVPGRWEAVLGHALPGRPTHWHPLPEPPAKEPKA